MISDQQFLGAFHSLPPDKQATAVDFIGFLHDKLAQVQTTQPKISPVELQLQTEAEGEDE